MSDTNTISSINPYTGKTIHTTQAMDNAAVEGILRRAEKTAISWRQTTFDERSQLLHKASDYLEQNKERLAEIITQEMGKLYQESLAEIEKSAWCCRYYADHGASFMADELVETGARKSLVIQQPIGAVLAVMPWNFPFWQVFRFAAPAVMAGNVGLLKHASNVSQCALAIEECFNAVGFPSGVFSTLLISSAQVEDVIRDPRIKAVTLTGSEPAGRAVASTAADALKKSVLELGGSDAFIVLGDADLEHTVSKAVVSRFMNAGQSCIAAKRFIVLDEIAESFVAALSAEVSKLQMGDPMREDTTLAPMARDDLREELHQQVQEALDKGAVAVTGCAPVADTYAYYAASILDHITPEMRVWNEELFGPVALIIRVSDAEEALRIANASSFGLGGSVWTEDRERGEQLARQLDCGCAFVNELVKSDPRLPFGGTKRSGFGRELGRYGILEFVNTKTLWID